MQETRAVDNKKHRKRLDPCQTGFLQYEILSRIWIEGTLRIKELDEQIIEEVIDAFRSTYPHDSEKCSTPKIRRLYNEMRPVRFRQDGEATPSGVAFAYSEPVKRHAALFALQQQATRVLDEHKQLVAEASLEALPDFAEHLAHLANISREFEDWCIKHGRDVVAACNTRNALRNALEQLNNLTFTLNTGKQQELSEEEPATLDDFIGGTKGVASSIYSKHFTFMKKVETSRFAHRVCTSTKTREQKPKL